MPKFTVVTVTGKSSADLDEFRMSIAMFSEVVEATGVGSALMNYRPDKHTDKLTNPDVLNWYAFPAEGTSAQK